VKRITGAGMRTAAFAAAAILLLTASAEAGGVTVPFVGCPTDSLTAPFAAPKGNPVSVSLDAKPASRLAFYKSQIDQGIIGPRGWHCLSFKAASGWVTIVMPHEPSPPTMLRYPAFHPIKGPAIQITHLDGLSAGRLDIAKLSARYFPQHEFFVKFVIATKVKPASEFPQGPYAGDKLINHRQDIVEYLTPAGKEGLGTAYRLVPGDLPIQSFAATVGPDEELHGFVMGVRLPKSDNDLAPAILAWAERQYVAGK
jgi:hypothetical protein